MRHRALAVLAALAVAALSAPARVQERGLAELSLKELLQVQLGQMSITGFTTPTMPAISDAPTEETRASLFL